MGGLTAHTLYILGGGVEAVGGPEDPEEEDIEKGGYLVGGVHTVYRLG